MEKSNTDILIERKGFGIQVVLIGAKQEHRYITYGETFCVAGGSEPVHNRIVGNIYDAYRKLKESGLDFKNISDEMLDQLMVNSGFEIV